jgi:hypothetical protein
MVGLEHDSETGPQLSPEVRAALTDLTKWVYDSYVSSFLHPRRLTTHCHLDDPNGSGRSATVGMFKHLKHFRVPWNPDLVVRWAEYQGWLTSDLALLNEFAVGVKAGTRFHTGPDVWPRPTVESWLRGNAMTAGITKLPNFRLKKCCRGHFKLPARRRHSHRAALQQFSRED